MLKVTIAGGFAVGALFLAGCSSQAEQTENANAELCQSVTALQTTVDEVAGNAATAVVSGSGITVDQAQLALGNIDAMLDEVRADASNLTSDVADQFATAISDYQDALRGVPGSSSLSDAATQVQSAQQDLAASYAAIKTDLGC